MRYNRSVKVWLFIGLVCVFIQVLVGGITRLTESGLSITEWEPISGVVYPFSNEDWAEAFDKYKDTPQYEEKNEGMSLSDFKFIYFWEFIHRQWARVMGLIFLVPFLFFWRKGYFDNTMFKKLGLIILLAILAASFGWIMVASGLIDRPWVNAYKLSFHLCIAFSVFVAILYAWMHANKEELAPKINFSYNLLFKIFVVILWIQVFLGGIMSGMRIGVAYPTWPDMYGEYFPQVLFNSSLWNVDNFNNYDQNELMPALIHFLHRSTAYIVFLLGIYLAYRLINSRDLLLRNGGLLLGMMLVVQVCIGIITVINSIGEIPIFLGVMHQAGALLLIGITYVNYYMISKNK